MRSKIICKIQRKVFVKYDVILFRFFPVVFNIQPPDFARKHVRRVNFRAHVIACVFKADFAGFKRRFVFLVFVKRRERRRYSFPVFVGHEKETARHVVDIF